MIGSQSLNIIGIVKSSLKPQWLYQVNHKTKGVEILILTNDSNKV